VKRVRAEILSTRRLGDYTTISLVAPEIAERARPGQFLAIAMPQGRETILRRQFAIHQASRRGGWAGTLEFVVQVSGEGTSWLANARAHETLDVIGPLGKPFSYPKRLTNCLLLAEGRGAAVIYFLAQELLARHKRVDMVIGGRSLDGVFKPIEAKRLSQTVAVMTADGSLGETGSVLDALPEALDRSKADVLYAAARPATLRSVAEVCVRRRIPAQVAVEERMGCGLGLCFTCVVPLASEGGDGYEHVRACVDGPVLNPARILWDRWLAGSPEPAVPTLRGAGPAARERPGAGEGGWRA
jgi:dihydroorotate dehydrogenase electron transfer subunit